jgi:hypothetical protein
MEIDKGLVIPILYHTPDTRIKRDTELTILRSEFDVRDAVFYNIESLTEMFHETEQVWETTIVTDSGEPFGSPLRMMEIHKLIQKAIGNTNSNLRI